MVPDHAGARLFLPGKGRVKEGETSMEMQHIIRLDLKGVNSYLIPGSKGFILVDTGGYIVTDKDPDNRRDILVKQLTAAGCHPGDLQLILLTHGDYDHTGNARWISETYHAPIAMHPLDRPLVWNVALEDVMQSFQYQSWILKLVFSLMKPTITKATKKILEELEAFQPDILLEDGMDLLEYGVQGKILHLPGHTPGSVGVLLSDGSLLAGDTLRSHKGKSRRAMNAMDFTTLERSVAKLETLSVKTVYPGHGETVVRR